MQVAIGEPLSIADVVAVARGDAQAVLSPRGREALALARAAVEAVVQRQSGPPTYGVDTGFGALAEVRVDKADLARLQLNLLRSHAVGVGPALTQDIVRAMMLLRAQVLATGYSGVRVEVVERLVALIAARVHPVIPSLGSVGACGDLAPLAHLALVLVGEGEADVAGARMSGAEALAHAGVAPLALAAKEGLSLINGTAAMLAVGALALAKAQTLVRTADVTGAMSLEALLGSVVPFEDAIIRARPHPGALASAAHLRALLEDSEINRSHVDCAEVQDAYSLRCMPQVHGSARDLLDYVERVLSIELNAATDNPLVLGDGRIRSGGNFHGQPVAAALDVGSIALVDLASISERRIAYLVDAARSRGLPAFIARSAGLESGFMMAQVTAASLVAEARALATPRSMDSIPTSAEREDHVSMGMSAARAFAEVATLCAWVLAIEAVVAGEGVERRGLAPGRGVAHALAALRKEIAPLTGDRALSGDFAKARSIIEDGKLLG